MTNPIDYCCHGLTIRADFALEEAAASDGTAPQVHVTSADVPRQLNAFSAEGTFFQASESAFLLNVPGVARYLVRDGNEIEVAPLTQSDAVRYFLYGSPMAALHLQRKSLALQGSAVQTPHGALLLLGLPASGKSVVAAAMHRAGFPLLADDLCVVDSDAGCLLPGPRFHWLWKRDVEQLHLGEAACQIRPGVDRYFVPLSPQSTVPVPIFAICVLDAWNENSVRMVPISRAGRSLILIGNLYHRTVLEACFKPLENLQRISAMSRVAFYKLWCTRQDRSLKATIDELCRGLKL